jgi:2-dehydropantoate 2-reductase
MRICIVGAGAIGCYLGAKLALSDEKVKVTILARGTQLNAIQQKGILLKYEDGSTETAVPTLATNDIYEAGTQDVIILAVKAQNIPEFAPTLQALYGPDTLVISAQNGVPWWYFQKQAGEFEERNIETVDPGGIISSYVNPNQVIGCVLHLGAQRLEPGVIKPTGTKRILLGELDGTITQRLQSLSEVFSKAGFEVTLTNNIRSEIWYKLWGNLAHNPISALTRANLRETCQFVPVRELVMDIMKECESIAEKLGIQFKLTKEERIKITEAMGDHKPSMLQDIEEGKQTEVDTLIGTVMELGRMTSIPTPHINTIYATMKLLDLKNRGIKI